LQEYKVRVVNCSNVGGKN